VLLQAEGGEEKRREKMLEQVVEREKRAKSAPVGDSAGQATLLSAKKLGPHLWELRGTRKAKALLLDSATTGGVPKKRLLQKEGQHESISDRGGGSGKLLHGLSGPSLKKRKAPPRLLLAGDVRKRGNASKSVSASGF